MVNFHVNFVILVIKLSMVLVGGWHHVMIKTVWCVRAMCLNAGTVKMDISSIKLLLPVQHVLFLINLILLTKLVFVIVVNIFKLQMEAQNHVLNVLFLANCAVRQTQIAQNVFMVSSWQLLETAVCV